MKTIYRAADDDSATMDTSFAERLEDAQAYLNNPGFGGAQVWRFEVEIEDENLLDFTVDERAAWRRIAQVLGKSIEQVEDGGQGIVHPFFDNATMDELESLAEAGIMWVRYEDSYPAGCITMRYIGDDVFFAQGEAQEAEA